MFDLPLHPIAVHFPIVLGILLPIAALTIALLIYKRLLPGLAWVLVIALSFGYVASAKFAEEMGERDEHMVEKVVSEQALEAHEEAGEFVPIAAGILFVLSLVPLLNRGRVPMMFAYTAIATAAILPLVQAGHTGGKLVYQHGAAQAHVKKMANNAGKQAAASGNSEKTEQHHDEENDSDDD